MEARTLIVASALAAITAPTAWSQEVTSEAETAQREAAAAAAVEAQVAQAQAQSQAAQAQAQAQRDQAEARAQIAQAEAQIRTAEREMAAARAELERAAREVAIQTRRAAVAVDENGFIRFGGGPGAPWVTFAGQETEPVRAVRTWVEPSAGPAVVWSTTGRCAPSSAALVNGTAAHALDYDDAGLTMPIHPSAVLWPSVLAVAPDGTPVTTVLAAVEAGHVLFRVLADLLPMDVHYRRGWHATSTLGRIAATLACARVLGLDPERTAHAVGIAASTASCGRS